MKGGRKEQSTTNPSVACACVLAPFLKGQGNKWRKAVCGGGGGGGASGDFVEI